MKIYLDSSALVKLVQTESESGALRRYLRQHPSDDVVSSDLARVEVVRAVRAGGSRAVARARYQLSQIYLITLDKGLLDEAAALDVGSSLRTLDAIHLASASLLTPDLRAVVTYDQRMVASAVEVGMPATSPAE